jgi:cytochrome b561
MAAREPGKLNKWASKVKNYFLILLFLFVPLAGAFHPKLRRKEDPEGKEIGTEK